MEIKLVSPTVDDASFWLKVRLQASTQNNNPIGVLSLEQLKEQIQSSCSPISERRSVHRFIIRKERRSLGVISIKDINWSSGVGEIGYLVDEAVHRQGVATEALRQILKIAFKDGGLNKLKATTIVENIASNRVLEKNGFQREGLLRKEFLVRDQLHDVISWGILKHESFNHT